MLVICFDEIYDIEFLKSNSIGNTKIVSKKNNMRLNLTMPTKKTQSSVIYNNIPDHVTLN